MSTDSNIEWTDTTWNPVTGCSFASEGCRNCYAVAMTHRLEAMGQTAKYGGLTVLNARGERQFNGTVKTHDDALTAPLGWKKPRKVFVNSMSDLFHPGVPFDFIDKVFAVMALTPQHTYQVLTKRPDRMSAYFSSWVGAGPWNRSRGWDYVDGELRTCSGRAQAWPLPNLCLGTSVEDQAAAIKRIQHLLECPAAVRFLSMEPLLGSVEFSDVTQRTDAVQQLGKKALDGIHWVIAGGESGPGARPMQPDWARSIRDQCAAANVPFFFKQWGEWWWDVKDSWGHEVPESKRIRTSSGAIMKRVGKKAAGRELDGVTHDAFPELPTVPA